MDIKDFPQEEIDFWAPTREKLSGSNISAADKVREIVHRWRYFPRKFNPERGGMKGMVKRSKFAVNKSSLHLSIEPGGDVELDTTVHELFHIYLITKGIVVSQEDAYGKMINEGLGTIGSYLPTTVEEGKIPMISVTGSTDENFESFRASIKQNDRNNLLEDKAYDPANTILHWYLLSERGGMENMRELARSVPLPIDGRVTHNSLISGYEKAYGEPMIDLVDKAEAWYKEQIEPNEKESNTENPQE